ncbi:MAG: hypothetical protein WCD34_12795 [Candidatus Acidiferrum sp.]
MIRLRPNIRNFSNDATPLFRFETEIAAENAHSQRIAPPEQFSRDAFRNHGYRLMKIVLRKQSALNQRQTDCMEISGADEPEFPTWQFRFWKWDFLEIDGVAPALAFEGNRAGEPCAFDPRQLYDFFLDGGKNTIAFIEYSPHALRGLNLRGLDMHDQVSCDHMLLVHPLIDEHYMAQAFNEQQAKRQYGRTQGDLANNQPGSQPGPLSADA